MEYNYNMGAMKSFLKTLKMPKQKKEMCIAGIEMYLLNEQDLTYIAKADTTLDMASKFLHKKIMSM